MAGKTREELNEIGKNTQFKSGTLAAESGRKGGIASGKAKKETRLFKDVIQQRLAERGLTMEMISDKVIDMAIEHGGKDFEILRDTIGQKPSDKVEVKAVSIEDILKGNDPGL